MNSGKNTLIALLSLTSVGGALLAWHQYQELVTLRAAVMDRDERAASQMRLWDAQKRSASLEQRLATTKPAAADPTEPEEAAATADVVRERRGRGGFMAMMENPEMQKLLHVGQKAALDARYSALFKALNLSPEQLEKFKNLLVEKQTSMMDVLMAAREQGINPREDPEAFRKLVGDAQAEIDTSIQATLGDLAYSQYQAYEQTMPQRNTVSQLDQRLSYSATPLSDAQSEQMVKILANTGETPGGGMRGAVLGGAALAIGGRGGAAPVTRITDTTIAQAQGVLAGPQLDALRQLQQEQQAQAKLQQTMRQQFQNGAPPPPGGAPGRG